METIILKKKKKTGGYLADGYSSQTARSVKVVACWRSDRQTTPWKTWKEKAEKLVARTSSGRCCVMFLYRKWWKFFRKCSSLNGGVDSANSAPDIPELDPILWKKDFSCGWRLTLRLLRRCCKDQPCESEGRRLAVWILKINPTVFFHSTCFIVLFTKENDTSTLKLMNSLYHTDLVNFPHTRGADETVTKGRKSVESRNKDTKKKCITCVVLPRRHEWRCPACSIAIKSCTNHYPQSSKWPLIYKTISKPIISSSSWIGQSLVRCFICDRTKYVTNNLLCIYHWKDIYIYIYICILYIYICLRNHHRLNWEPNYDCATMKAIFLTYERMRSGAGGRRRKKGSQQGFPSPFDLFSPSHELKNRKV